jgi:fibronectin-binding autotransporter adhesin
MTSDNLFLLSKPIVQSSQKSKGMNMNSSSFCARFFSKLIMTMALALFGLTAFRSQIATAQNLTINFRFDGQSGAAATTQSLIPGAAGQNFTVDVWATITGPAGTTGAKTGLVTLRFRGFSSTTSDIAFGTGNGVGVTSFSMLSPFNSTANIPAIGDAGSASGYATTNTALDGISDFGGTAATSAAVANSNAGITPELGGTATTTSKPVTNGWEFMIGQFVFHTGTASTTSGAMTSFLPVTGLGTSTTKQSFTVDGGTTFVHGDWTSGTAVNFAVVRPNGSASWNLNGNGNYSDLPNWDPNQIPGSAGLVATFGNGTTNTVNAPNVTVTVNAPERVGSVNFNNTNGTSFTLGNDGVAGDNLTLDNNGAGATVNSSTGNNWIFSNLVLADNATFNVAAGSSVLVSLGNISESGASRGVTKIGAGTLTIDTASTYTGTTSVTAGTLVTTPTGTISAGPLVVSAATGVTSLVSMNNNQTVSSLSGTVSGSGVATVSVASGTTLTVAQSSDTTFGGKLSLASSGGTLVKSGSGRLETQGAPTLGSGSAINVTGGTLRFNATSGAATIGTGVIATVSGTAVLELAGSVSALSSSGSPADRVNIANNSTAAAGLFVSGTNQQVGKIDGPGVTSVAPGGSLTANHIVESALVISGAAGTPATVTIAASDASGNSLAESSGFASSHSLSSTASSSAGTLTPSSLLAAGGGPSIGPNIAGASVGGTELGMSSTAVPEPPALVLMLLGCLLAICLRKQLPATRLR